MNHEQELKDLSVDYGAALPAKLVSIKADWEQLKQQHDQTLLIDLIRKVHSLVGSGATFGFSALSTAAEKLERELRRHQGQISPPAHHAERLERLFAALESAAQRPCDYDISADTAYPLKTADMAKYDENSILIVSGNQAFTADLSHRLEAYNITSHIVSLTSDLCSMIEQINPCCIVVELTSNSVAELAALQALKHGLFTPPAMIVISNHHDIAAHLAAVRAGASAYFLTPFNIAELVTLIHLQSHPLSKPPYRILIVDDDEQFAHHTALLLQRAGMKTHVLTQPLNILEPLTSFQPEVILLDLYMPECNGIELANVIRQQSLYAGIHIVFFSVETDIERHIEALRTGGNDFFVKPMPPKQLIAKVEAKAKNARAVRKLMLHDGLTGALNRSHFMETINRQIAISQRQQGCFSYVILDLDNFKQINDRYGHQAGDEVLKALAELATQRLRSVDSVIRYGGEEFVILLPDTKIEQAERVINDLLQKFSVLSFKVDEQFFSVTFSAGIAQYPTYSDAIRLAEAADKALYQAKAAGRNQVCFTSIIGK